MKRREPPPLATWMLEHLTLGDRDEALGGDLLEHFRFGRSEGWYWRQVLAACSISWLRGLRARASLLFLTTLWTMLAPAWKVVCDRIQGSPSLEHLWQMAGGFWVLPAFAIWLALHACFLWTGVLFYVFVNRSLGKRFHAEQVRRAVLLAPLIFAPVFGATFLLVNLYWYSAFPNAKLAATPLGQIADIGRLADAVRLPYLIALVSALWGLIPQSMRSPQTVPSELASADHEAHSFLPPLASSEFWRFIVFLVFMGLTNSMLGEFLLCRLPQSNTPDLPSLLGRALVYVVVGAVGGVAGTWIYWRNPSSPFRASAPLPFKFFALVCAAGWVWVPSMVIFSEELSLLTALVAMIGAFVLISGLRWAAEFTSVPALAASSSGRVGDGELFAESLYQPPIEMHGYAIALSLFAATAAIVTHSVYSAAALLALSACLFAWERPVTQSDSGASISRREVHRAALRLARVAIPAVLVTVWALLDGVAHRMQPTSVDDRNSAATHSVQKPGFRTAAYGFDGYESLILWPFPEKRNVIAPIPMIRTLLVPGTTKPLIIRFDGPYWFVQPPDKRPGPMAHEAHGNPTSVNIQ